MQVQLLSDKLINKIHIFTAVYTPVSYIVLQVISILSKGKEKVLRPQSWYYLQLVHGNESYTNIIIAQEAPITELAARIHHVLTLLRNVKAFYSIPQHSSQKKKNK